MRKYVACLLFIIALVVAGCGDGDHDKQENNRVSSVGAKEQDGVKEEDVEGDSPENVENEEVDEVDAPSDITSVLKSVGEAMSHVESGVIAGTVDADHSLAGVKEKETTEYVGKYSFNPVVYYTKGETSSSLDGLFPLEMYFTEDYFYAYVPDYGSWVRMDNVVDSEALTFINESKINIMLDHIEKFELTEDNDHYIVTYVGPEEEYKDLVHIAILDTGEVNISGWFGALYEETRESMEVSGGLKIFIDKDSFLTTKLEIDYVMSMNIQGVVSVVDHESTITFSEFNSLDEVVVPADVLENVVEMPGI